MVIKGATVCVFVLILCSNIQYTVDLKNHVEGISH